ncbi:MAG: hypothetical protein U5K28_06405 [Halobacteriales archaeon]|nr:hypothetical protein [Halobacteriales archaeon]
MEFDETTTGGLFIALVAVALIALILAPIPMEPSTILMMVAPSMLVFGAICLVLGVKLGEQRASRL